MIRLPDLWQWPWNSLSVGESCFQKPVQSFLIYIYILTYIWKWKSLSLVQLLEPKDCSRPGSSLHRILQYSGLRSHSLFQGILQTQGLNPGLPCCRQILYHLSHQGSHTHTHTQTHTHMCIHTHTHIEMHALTHTCTHRHTRTHTCTHTETHTCTHAHIDTHTDIHTHVHTHTHRHTHTHTQTHTHTHSSTLAWRIPWTRSLVGHGPPRRKASDTTEGRHFHFSFRSWFTVLGWLHMQAQQFSYTQCLSVLFLVSPIEVTTEYWAEFPVLPVGPCQLPALNTV